MTPTEFRLALRALAYNQRRFAARVGVDERTVQRWVSGATRIPARVALVLELEAERAATGRPSEAARAPDRA